MTFNLRYTALAWLLLIHPVHAVQTVEWDKTVIELQLIAGVEQLVHFTGPATVVLPPTLGNTNVFRHLFTSDTAYWKALQPFQSQRIKVRLESSGDFILFDVSAVTKKHPPKAVEPITIVMPEERVTPAPAPKMSTLNEVTMFDLLRYAVQQDNSPERVVAPLDGVHAIESPVRHELSALYHHDDNVRIDIFVKAAWSANQLYVTSLIIRNRTNAALTMDPSRMQHTALTSVNGVSNQFIAAAMVDRSMAGRGAPNREDSTTMYIVTDRPFESVIQLPKAKNS